MNNKDDSPPHILAPLYNAGHIDPGVSVDKTKSPFYPSRARTSAEAGLLNIELFDPPETCWACHTDIYDQWKGSMHSNAWHDPVYRALMRLAGKATNGLTDNLCIGCHTPAGLTTGEASPTGERMGEISKNGVFCEVCHNISASTGIGNTALVLTPRKYGRPLKFGPFKDARSPYHDTEYSELHTTSALCGACHNVTHPFNRLPIERTYDEWKDSPYPAEGLGCQECHMTPGTGYTKNPGRAAIGAPMREHIFTHYFVGGNTMVTALLGSQKHSKLAEEMLQGAARMEILFATNVRPGGVATVDIRVRNIGAGHKLPTGFPEGREMWIDFIVLDENGKVIYRLGRLDEEGRLDRGTHIFKVSLGDSEGNLIDLELWKATQILYDTRILPRGYADVRFEFRVPEDAKGTLSLKADLCYHSFPQPLVNYLLGSEAPKVPTVIMTSVSGRQEISR
ncbi:MAG TPA: multiheme c-type cytochrome [Nitrospirota bacterium]|nr:multiheme c-type cytochrome [Nitrospirota bacterium]